MKLDIGSGRKPHKGYKTIDIEEYANPDYLGDFREMTFKDVEAIRAHHLLEHFPIQEVPDILSLWYSWLKPGGVLLIEVPDFEGVCREWEQTRYKDRFLLFTFGTTAKNEWGKHYYGWHEENLSRYFKKAGFKIQKVIHHFTRNYKCPLLTMIGEK